MLSIKKKKKKKEVWEEKWEKNQKEIVEPKQISKLKIHGIGLTGKYRKEFRNLKFMQLKWSQLKNRKRKKKIEKMSKAPGTG